MKAAYYEGRAKIRVGSCSPAPPGPGEVQIKVSHCGICGTDLHIFHGKMDHRVKVPHVPGHEMSGVIAAVGEGVADWREGDRVTVRPLAACGRCAACAAGYSHICMNLRFLGIDTPGAMQEYWLAPAHALHRLPDSLSLEHAALVEPVAVACHDVRLGEVAAGEFVVVQGGGPIGLLIALVCRLSMAEVLISEVNGYRRKLARSLGIEAVDPQTQNLAAFVNERTEGAGAHVVFDAAGTGESAAMMTQLARPRGRIVMVAIHSQPAPVDLFRFFWRELRLIGARVYEPVDFERAIQIAASGELPLERLVTRVLPLDNLESAFRELEQGGEAMKILVRCSE